MSAEMIERKEKQFTLCVFDPAGMKHYASLSMADDMLEGQRVELRLERSNEYDALAIELYWHPDQHGGSKFGYVPRPLNQAVASLLHAGYTVEAQVARNGDSKVKILVTEK